MILGPGVFNDSEDLFSSDTLKCQQVESRIDHERLVQRVHLSTRLHRYLHADKLLQIHMHDVEVLEPMQNGSVVQSRLYPGGIPPDVEDQICIPILGIPTASKGTQRMHRYEATP